VLVYTYVGYPLALAALARLRPLRTREDPAWRPTVTACVPAHDAARFLDAKIASLLAQDYPGDRLEVIVYSDGSTDGTPEVVLAWAARDPRVRLVRGDLRLGKPAGLNRLFVEATGEVLLLTDARQPLVPGALTALVARLFDPAVGCVTGRLVLAGAAGSGAYWRYETWIRRHEGAFRGVVGATGSITALRRRDFTPLPPDLILDDVWIPMRLALAGRRILFAEDAVATDEAFDDGRELGRKVRTLAGNYQILARLPALLSPRANPLWFETISHKVMRLVCPFALLALAAASTMLCLRATADPARWLSAWLTFGIATGQVLLYAGAIAGAAAGRVGRLARTFVVVHYAALLGLARFLRGRQSITW
jgi:cellulose synthase/poly-beta-1,6-N-acetylglucosamine synthase-like glycosyltransferase